MILFKFLRGPTEDMHKNIFSQSFMFKLFYILHLLKNIHLRRFSEPGKKCFPMDCRSRSMPEKNEGFCVICWAVNFNDSSAKTILVSEIKTNQMYDKCLWPGSRVFTLQQLAFKTKEFWLKMNRTEPELVFNAPWKSPKVTATVYKAHRFAGLGYEYRGWSPSLCGSIYF